MIKTACISFMITIQSQGNLIPEQIKEIYQNKIQEQWSYHNPEISLSFDKKTCQFKGQYVEDTEDVILNAQNELWSGELKLSYDDLIQGKKIYFPPQPIAMIAEKAHYESKSQIKSKNKFWKKFLWGSVISSLALTAGGLGYHRYKKSKKSNKKKYLLVPKIKN